MTDESKSRQTIEYYNQQIQTFVENTLNLDMSELYKEFEVLVKPKGRILDAGCGPGRDSLYFLKQGFDVIAFDASEAMVAYAAQLTGAPVLKLSFNELEFDNEFDGIWACASMLHVPHFEMDSVITRIIRALIPGGILYTSFKYGNEEVFRNGRLFSNYTKTTFLQLCSRHPKIKILKIWQTTDVRPNRTDERWLNVLCRKL